MKNMYKPFQNGVTGVLNIDWILRVEEPLVIRNGSKAAFRTDAQKVSKGRGSSPQMRWQNARSLISGSQSDFSEIADFNYHFRIDGDQVLCEYSIPASSIRGAMRNQAIRRNVEIEKRSVFSLPNKENTDLAEIEARINAARAELADRRSGWSKVLSLFGAAFELDESQQNPLTWAGRLSLQTSLPPDRTSRHSHVSFWGQNVNAPDNPAGPAFNVGQRSPLDRITQSAKTSGGGLHAWLELAKGETFNLNMRLLNPCNQDIQLLSMWRAEIDSGFLSFGGLQSVGKGEASLQGETYKLHLSKTSPVADELLKVISNEQESDDALFSGIWLGGELPSFQALQSLNLDAENQN